MSAELPISPTLAKFLKVPYNTRMTEEDITLKIWNYIIEKNLFIDNRTLLLDRALQPVFHPPFYYRGNDDTEDSFVMIFIAKMHTDPSFICKDVSDRLVRIGRTYAALRIQNWFRLIRKRSTESAETTKHLWSTYLANHYGGSDN